MPWDSSAVQFVRKIGCLTISPTTTRMVPSIGQLEFFCSDFQFYIYSVFSVSVPSPHGAFVDHRTFSESFVQQLSDFNFQSVFSHSVPAYASFFICGIYSYLRACSLLMYSNGQLLKIGRDNPWTGDGRIWSTTNGFVGVFSPVLPDTPQQ